MRLSRRSAIAVTGLGLLGPATAAGPTAGARTWYEVDKHPADLDDLVLQTLARTGIPGLSIAITNSEKVVYLKGFGVRQVGKSEPVDPDTVFELASMSKPIASTVVAALVGDGLVGWDDLIIRHLPDFAMDDSWVTSQTTLRDMFCHRSGLPDHAGDMLEDIGYDRPEVLHRLRYMIPDSSFRSQTSVSRLPPWRRRERLANPGRMSLRGDSMSRSGCAKQARVFRISPRPQIALSVTSGRTAPGLPNTRAMQIRNRRQAALVLLHGISPHGCFYKWEEAQSAGKRSSNLPLWTRPIVRKLPA
jgi:hypothetical protein